MKAKDLLFDMISKYNQNYHNYSHENGDRHKKVSLHIYVLRSIYYIVSVCMTVSNMYHYIVPMPLYQIQLIDNVIIISCDQKESFAN